MKKSYYIFALLALIIFSGVMFFLTRFNEASLIARDGFVVSGEDMDEVLLNENKVAKTGNVKLNKITSNDTFYSNLDKIYVGEEKKTEVNIVYPMYINNGLGIVNLDSTSKLINNKFEMFDTYENFTVTGGKLYNFGDYEQADYENYILLQLSNGTYINLLPVTITTASGPKEIPENSVINFQENYLNFYSYNKKGKMIYKIVDGVNLNDIITFKDFKYTYERLLYKLGKYEPPAKEEIIEEEEPTKEDYIIIIKNDEPQEAKYIAPKVKVTSFTPNVYSAKASLSISDPSRVIVGGINFEFYVNDKVYLRKTFVSGGAIEVTGLVPNQNFKIVGSYKYYNEDSKKMEKTFFEQDISTLGVDILDPIDLTFENGEIYPNKIELLNFGITSDIKSETIKGVNKAVINIGDEQYSISTGLLQEILVGRQVTYDSPAKLNANTPYEYDIEFLDAYGNKIKIRNNKGSTRTSKNKPTASIKIASSQVNQVVTQVILKNVDQVKIVHYKYIIFDNLDMIIKEGNIDSTKETNNITLRDLNPNTTYNIQILGTYDVEDGKGTQVDQVMGEGKFTTAPLNSLGFYRVVASTTELESDKATISSRIDIENVNSILIELLNSFSISVTDEEGNLIYAHNYTGEELESLKLGEDFSIKLTDLQSVTTYNIDYAAVVKQGSVKESINVLCSFKNFKTYKRKAEVQLRNEFVTGTFIDFDVRIVDVDGAIESPRALLEVRDEGEKLVGKEYLGINQDFVQLTYDHLEKNKEYKLTFYVEEYNIGFTNQTYQSDYHLLEKVIKTEEGVKATIELTGLERQINGKNLFNIEDFDRIRKEGNTPYKKYDLLNNTVMFGAKNGYVTHSYFLPEAYHKTVVLTFKARYSKDSPNKAPAYIGMGYGNNQNFRINDLTEEYKDYTFVFYMTTKYIGFNVVETANQNKKTTVDFKDIQVQYLDLLEMADPDVALSYSETGYKFTNTEMIDGNHEMPNPNGGTTLGKTGNGSARITNIETGEVKNYNYTGSPQTFTAPKTGWYKIECWGAAGGDSSNPVGSQTTISSRAGRGAYTSGEVMILANKSLYVYVGGAGIYGTGNKAGGWNGGGNNGRSTSNGSGSGGGATDVRTINGAWNNIDSLKSRIMVAGGGGGGDNAGGTLGGGDDGRGGCGGNTVSEGAYINGVATPSFFAAQTYGYAFGQGGQSASVTDTGGGGGGWYGGSSSNNNNGGGGGGSSYISGHLGCVAYSKAEEFLSKEKYKESSKYKGSFEINMYDLRDELVNKKWYVRIYRKGKEVGIYEYDLTDLSMENIKKSYEFDKNVNYTVKISVNVRERFYDLAEVTFTTENEIRAIRTPQDFQGMHSNGKYIVLNDLDFGKTSYSYESYFYGEVDFQGHTVRRQVNNGNHRMFNRILAGSLIKNLVVDYYLDNTSSITNFHGIVLYNYGTLDNIMVNLKECNNNPNAYISLITRENYGIVKNFVINAEVPLHAIAGSGYLAWYNSGIIRNGYVYGSNIYAYYQNVETRDKKDIGGLVGYAEYNSRIETVYSLVSVEKSNTYGTGDREMVVSNIVGRHQSGYFGNSYSVELPGSVNTNQLTQDPNIGFKNGLRSNMLYYESEKKYGGKFSSKISKLALYDRKFQNDVLNKYDGFIVDSFVDLGYFPQVAMNECMPKQQWIELPKVTDADLVDVTSVEEVENYGDSAKVILHINNPAAEKIEKVTITNIGTVKILEQKDLYGKTDLTVELSNPTAYKSIYYVDTLTMKPAYGSNYERMYEKNERAINVDLYYPIRELADWKKVVANPSQNYALMNDIDFMNTSMTQYMVTSNVTAKIDGRGHTLKNITINSGNGLFTRLSGGTLKNLNIENYKKTNSTYRGGIIYETNGNSVIDNVHVKNVQVYGTNHIGGLLGYGSYTTIKNCSVTNFKPLTPTEAEDLYVGGIVGYSDYLFVENCYTQDLNINITDAISTLGVGGIGGAMWSGSVSNCYAVGKINCNSVNVGGIFGYGGSRVFNVWTDVDIMTNLDYVGGIVGKRDGSNISNTLSVGAVYSSYKSNETNNINRTTGNYMEVIQNNYAWDKQKFLGFVKGDMASEILLSSVDLQEENTYLDLIGFDETNFSLAGIENNCLPKLKNPETGELLPYQKDVQLKGEMFDITITEEPEITATYANILFTIENPKQLKITGVKFNSLTPSNARFVNNPDEGTTSAYMTVTPTEYFDSYILNEIDYQDSQGRDQPPYEKMVRFDLQFFKNISTYDDWTHVSKTVPENYRLTGDVDFEGKVNIKTGVMFSRLEGLLKQDGTTYSIKNYSKTGITSSKTNLIRIITTTLKNVTFENISLQSTQWKDYINVIYLNYSDVDNVIFRDITLKSQGSYIAPIARHRGQNFRNVKVYNTTATGADYVGGLLAHTYNTPSNDIYGEGNTLTATGRYCGGLIAYRDYRYTYNSVRYVARDMTITGKNDVGGMFGYGGSSYGEIYDSEITSTGGGEYVGGIGGRSCFVDENDITVSNVTINANANYVGGAYGYARNLHHAIVKNSIIKQTNANKQRVGGAYGYSDSWFGHNNTAVIDTTITNAGDYTGGIIGRMYSTSNTQYSFVNNVSINGRNYVGGIAGDVTTGRAYRVIINANITATGNYVGGAFGFINSIHESDTNYSCYVQEILIANTKLTGNNYVGGFVGATASGKQLTKLFFNIIIAADCNTAVTSNPYIGAVNGQDTRLYSTVPLTTFRIYKNNRLNGIYVNSLGLPNIASEYFADQTNLGTQSYYTNLNFATARWDFSKLSSGYFPQVKRWSGGSIRPEQKALVRPEGVVQFSARRLMDAPIDHKLPDLKVYSSGVNTLNLEFSSADDYTYFEVLNGGTKVIDENLNERTYTINADYKSEIEVVVSDGRNTKKYQIKENEFRQIASTYGKKYAYIYSGKLKGNISAPKDKFIHIYKNYALTDEYKVYDIDKEEFVDDSFDFETGLELTKPLFKFEYNDTEIDTFYNYSVVHKKDYDITYDNQLFVKNNTIQIVDKELDSDHNSIIVDEYAEKEYVSVLGLDGNIYDLKAQLNKPSNFSNKGIMYMTNNISSSTSAVVLVYKTGKIVVFDYRTGKEIEQEKANDDVSIFDYFKDNFKVTEPITGGETTNSYQEALELEKALKETPIDKDSNGKYVMRDEETKEKIKKSGEVSGGGSITREYITYYNPVRDDYDVVDVESILEGEEEEVVTEKNKIYTSNALVEYYMKPSIFEEVLGNVNGLYIFGGILVAIITALGLFMRNAKLLKINEEGYNENK